mmetsp:Transcript_7646/g.16679  ORF Transcript_7646/g.16679 Transcript_7646/m.16679 type:complete len:223 (+) Transcript_7646:1192-1860(+)
MTDSTGRNYGGTTGYCRPDPGPTMAHTWGTPPPPCFWTCSREAGGVLRPTSRCTPLTCTSRRRARTPAGWCWARTEMHAAPSGRAASTHEWPSLWPRRPRGCPRECTTARRGTTGRARRRGTGTSLRTPSQPWSDSGTVRAVRRWVRGTASSSTQRCTSGKNPPVWRRRRVCTDTSPRCTTSSAAGAGCSGGGRTGCTSGSPTVISRVRISTQAGLIPTDQI